MTAQRFVLTAFVAAVAAAGVSASVTAVEPTIVQGPAGQVTMEREDAACLSLEGIFERLDNLTSAMEGRGDFSNTLPPPPPECVDIVAGTQVEATGAHAAYTISGMELWFVEVDYGSEFRWVPEAALR